MERINILEHSNRIRELLEEETTDVPFDDDSDDEDNVYTSEHNSESEEDYVEEDNELSATYSVARNTRRWPIAVVFCTNECCRNKCKSHI